MLETAASSRTSPHQTFGCGRRDAISDRSPASWTPGGCFADHCICFGNCACGIFSARIRALGADGETITVRLSSFAFDPDHLRLKAGAPVGLRLVNESSGGHDFSAPAFFAASSFPPGVPAPPDGKVVVGSHQTVEITVVPRTVGVYRLECTHFLHSLFGMHGTVEGIPQRWSRCR
jgi:plastocyanin